MKNVNLKDVLVLETIKNNIKQNLELGNSCEELISRTINANSNRVSIIANVDCEQCDFENTLYADYAKEEFLLESRLFSRIDGAMLGAYLELFDKDLNIIEEYCDDVWIYADWVVVDDKSV